MATVAKPTTPATNSVAEKETVTASLDSAFGAALIAAGIGAFVLGIMVILNEANVANISNSLKWVGPVGPLSGKVGISVIFFLLSWVGLHFAFRTRAVKLTTSFVTSLVLVALGLLLTFPPIVQALKHVLTGS